VGWFLVALASIGIFRVFERRPGWSTAGIGHWPFGGLIEPLIYLGIVVFNLGITFWIGEAFMGVVGVTVFAPVVVLFLTHVLNPMRRATAADVLRHREDYPVSPLAVRGRSIGAEEADARSEMVI
jgi:putative membrane protein